MYLTKEAQAQIEKDIAYRNEQLAFVESLSSHPQVSMYLSKREERIAAHKKELEYEELLNAIADHNSVAASEIDLDSHTRLHRFFQIGWY